MTTCRYPPHDWEEAMKLHETRLDDHLTDNEVAERFAMLDRMATCERCFVCGLVLCECDLGVRRGYGRAVLGVIGIAVAVCGVGALLYGIS